MKGKIAIANTELGRYAVYTEFGEYSIFDLITGTSLNAGDVVTGELNNMGFVLLRDASGYEAGAQIAVAHYTRAVAANWVAGN